ncbi:hypothetical protein ACLBWZ_10415 [Brucellaceae bacterium C25G]
MKMILFTFNGLLLVFSFLFLLCGVGAVIIDAARSIGGSMGQFTSLNEVLSGWLLNTGITFKYVHEQGLIAHVSGRILDLPAWAVFMTMALFLYLISNLFKKA